MITLYNYFRSSAAFRIRIALNYKGIEYSTIDIDLTKNEQKSSPYLTNNPAGLVPSLEDNKYNIHQSLAIMEYLEEKYSTTNTILPSGFFERAYVREIALSIACDIHPLNNLRVLNYLKNTLTITEEEKLKWYQHWIHDGLTALEKLVKNSANYTGKYCYKEQFTIADICLIPQLFNAKRFNCDLEQYPTLKSIEHECLKLEAVKRTYPNQ